MNKNVLITGVNGFVGEHVPRRFRDLGYDVTGTARQDDPSDKVADALTEYRKTNLLDSDSLKDLDMQRFSGIVHLAGRSAVGESFTKPHEYLSENAIMAYNLHDQAKEAGFKGRIISVSTGALYHPNQELPLTEESLTASNSPYAIGKLSAEAVTSYFRGRGVDSVIARPFNHIGPGQGTGFLLPDMYAQLQAAEAEGVIKTGNLETRRDYTDVRDIARANSDLAEAERLNHMVYNVCSNRSLSGFEILDVIRRVAGLEKIKAVVDPAKLRPNEIMDIRGNYDRIHLDTGWAPSIDIRQTIVDFVHGQHKTAS